MRLQLILALSILLLAAGCQSGGPSETEVAQKRWNDTRATILYGLASDQYKAHDFDKCKETLAKALAMAPDSPKLHTLAAKVAIEQGQLESAERDLETARRLGPTDPEPYYLSGVVYQRWQKPQTALEFYRQAGLRAPAELAYVLAESEMLVILNRQPEALQLLQSKVGYFENSAAIRDAAAQLLVQSGRYAEAIDLYRQASVLSEEDDGIRERMALACYCDHRYPQCAEILTRLTEKDACAKRADLLEMLGECRLNLNDAHGAVRSFEAASELNPTSAKVWQSLGRAILQEGELKRAEFALRRSLGVDNSSSETWLLLGYVQVRSGDTSDALKSFESASRLDPKDTTSLCMIGYTLEKTGRSREAAGYYARALRIRPSDQMASELMAAIDK